MLKDYKILLLLALAGLVFLALSLKRSADQDYIHHQKAYYKKLGEKDFTVEIKQVNAQTPRSIMVDRCQSCHIGASNPDAVAFEEPLAYHPPIVPFMEKDPHDFNKIGCAVCHDGNGRALEMRDAHGEYHSWPMPMLSGKSAQANCFRCHAQEGGKLAGAEHFERGRGLFLEKACWGCHGIKGVSNAKQAPELTNAGGKFSYDYLVESVIEPKANDKNSKMPRFSWVDDEEAVSAIATYLKGQQAVRLRSPETAPIGYKKPKPIETRISKPSVAAGRALFAGVSYEGSTSRGGCINCHAWHNSDGDITGGHVGPELTWAIRNRGRDYVKEHIVNARSHVPDSIMPSFKEYNDAEIESLVAYLSTFDYKLELMGLTVAPAADGGGAEPDRMAIGQKLYDTYCIACHGENLDGKGVAFEMLNPHPRNFGKHQFVIAYKERFKNSLLNGVAGSAMPPWKNTLSEREIDMLIDFIEAKVLEKAPIAAYRRISVEMPKPGDPERLDYRKNNPPLEAGRLEKGYEAFHKYCTSCHGKLANGRGPNSSALGHALPRNLVNRKFVNQASISDERLYRSILLGVAGTPMPAHDHLKDQTILDLIAFIRSNVEGTN